MTNTHKIEFTVDEGTWMSLDVTPDGRFIVFDLLGDLYRLPIAGGKAVPLTRGLAYDSQPQVSPDGKWVAFVSDRDGIPEIWMKSLEGGEVRKIAATSLRRFMASIESPVGPVWNPDGKSILARRAEDSKLALFYIDGRGSLTIGEGSGAETLTEAVFDPTGRFLYGPQGRQIVRVDLESGAQTAVTQIEAGATAFSPAISPNGKILVYIGTDYYDDSRLIVHRLDLQTGTDEAIGHTNFKEALHDASSKRLPNYDFTRDGRAVLIATRGKIQRIDVESAKSSEIPFSADVSLDVGPALDFKHRIEQGPVRARIVQDPQLSPDGRTLAFSVLTKIYTMRLPNGVPKQLTHADAWEYKPAWSPDGKWIAYVTWSMEGGHIWKARADGSGKPQRLTLRSALYTALGFSPDGQKIIGVRDSANRRERDPSFEVFGPEGGDATIVPVEIVWMPSSGGEAHVVSQLPSMTFPQFSPDARRVYFYSPSRDFRAGISKGSLLSTNLEGSDRRTHLSIVNPGEKDILFDKSMEISPDGKWVLVKVREQLYVLAVPKVGGAGPEIDVAASPVPCVRLTDIGVDYFFWADGGRTIAWALGSTFSRRPLASVDFSLREQMREAGAQPRDRDPAVQVLQIDMSFPRRTSRGTIALRHANVITMEKEGVLEDADILIVDNRIAAIGRRGGVAIPKGVAEVDLRGTFIVPGFVDTHAHWMTLKRYNVLEPQSWDLMANLAYGVTTSMDVQTSSDDAFVYQDLAATGQTLAPRLFSTGPGIVQDGAPLLSYQETLHYLRRYTDYFHTHYLKAYEGGPRKQSEWLVMAARELGVKMTAHPRIQRPIDGFSGYEHLPPMVPLQRDVIELFARTRIGVTPTLVVGRVRDYFEELNLKRDRKFNHFVPPNFIAENSKSMGGDGDNDQIMRDRRQAALAVAQILRAGGLIGVGSHGNWPGIQYHMEMWALALGLTSAEVLEAATLGGARILGLDRDVGSIATGKLADLIVLDKNPLEDIRNSNSIRYVMRNGELYEGDDLKQIWPIENDAPSFWWQRQAASRQP